MLIGVDKGMPLLSLACNASSHSIVAGTELVKPDAFVLFWYISTHIHQILNGLLYGQLTQNRDTRSPGKTCRQYVESHNDDVTEVKSPIELSYQLLC